MDERDHNASAGSDVGGSVLRTERVINATPEEIFNVIAQPELLAQWWGPSGFTNTFDAFEFTPGGRWLFTMHGPDGSDYANENIFRVIERHTRVVIEHILNPLFTLTITLTPREGGTHLLWEQEFEDAKVAAAVSAICGPANEQNLDRMEAVLRGEPAV